MPKRKNSGSRSGDWKKYKILSSMLFGKGIDNSKGMIERAIEKAKNKKNVTFILMDAESLGFSDHSFDYVVTTFVLRTISDPLKALTEMRHFLKPSGEMIALEHMHSRNPLIARFEELIDQILFFLLGDHTTRLTVRDIEEAALPLRKQINCFLSKFFGRFERNRKNLIHLY